MHQESRGGQQPKQPERQYRPAQGHTGGRDDLADYRLGELERRMESVESELKDLGKRVVEINTKMGDLPRKSHVYALFGVTLVVVVVGLVAHILIRSIAGS